MEQRDPKIWKYVENAKGYGGWRRRETLRAARRRYHAKKTTNPEYRAKRREKSDAYRAANPEKTRAAVIATRRRNHTRDKEANRISRYAVYSAKDRARRMGLAFDLDYKKLIIPDVCPILGIKLNDGSFDGKPTLDRTIPSLGYTMENTRVVSMKANRLKGDATIEDLRQIVAYLTGVSGAKPPADGHCPGLGRADNL